MSGIEIMQDLDIMENTEKFRVSGYEPKTPAGTQVFTFMPWDPKPGEVRNGDAWRSLRFEVGATQEPDGVHFDWSRSPDGPGEHKAQIEAEIRARLRDRTAWIERITALVGTVEAWAKESGWATRRIEKKLEDSRFGKHRVPALFMQADLARVLLEPLGRSSFGVEGIVDLYLMPRYDDIARITFSDGRWNLCNSFDEGEEVPLTKETLGKVLEEMRRHAA